MEWKTEIFLIDPQKTKVNQKTYIDFCCQNAAVCIQTMISSSCKTHRTKATQNFLPDNTPDFISSQACTLHSPDLNALDYSS